MSATGRAGPGRREQVLELLRSASEPLEISQLANRLQVHPNTVRFHLAPLIRLGEVEVASVVHAGPGRPPTAYRAVRRMASEGQREYRALAGLLAADLESQARPSRRAVELGRQWGRRLGVDEPTPRQRSARAARRHLRALLEGLGFAPETADDPRRIALRSCPFLELAETSTNVVCPIHLGLMQGTLDQWDAPLVVERLEAFAEPDLCVVHLGSARPTAPAVR